MPSSRLRRFIELRGWSYVDLAAAIGVSPSCAWRYLHGKRCPGLGAALAIERVTKRWDEGAIKAADWQPRRRVAA